MDFTVDMSAEFDKIVEAMATAKLEIKKAPKSRTNKAYGGSGYNYSTIDDILESFTTPFARQGLVVMQFPTVKDDKVSLTTIISHKSNQKMTSVVSIKPVNATAQSFGSTITYLKRYTLTSILGISCGEEDDDGNAANGIPSVPGEKKPSSTPEFILPTNIKKSVPVVSSHLASVQANTHKLKADSLAKEIEAAKDLDTVLNLEQKIKSEFPEEARPDLNQKALAKKLFLSKHLLDEFNDRIKNADDSEQLLFVGEQIKLSPDFIKDYLAPIYKRKFIFFKEKTE